MKYVARYEGYNFGIILRYDEELDKYIVHKINTSTAIEKRNFCGGYMDGDYFVYGEDRLAKAVEKFKERVADVMETDILSRAGYWESFAVSRTRGE